jgi:rubrerythrin
MLSYLREKAIFRHYSDANDKTNLPEAKMIFQTLAHEKKRYQNILREYYLLLATKMALPKSIEEFVGDTKVSLEKIHRNADLLDIFRHTLQVEKISFDFYENALERCQNKTLQKIFRFFIASERKHYYFLLEKFAN